MDIKKFIEEAEERKRQENQRLEGGERARFVARLEALEGVFEKALRDVQRLKFETEARWLAPIADLSYQYDTQLFTQNGSTKGIRDKIKKTLEARGEPMTSAQIAEALYVPDPKVSFDLFKRRIIVAASAMHKDNPPALLPADDLRGMGREVYWRLPEPRTKINFWETYNPAPGVVIQGALPILADTSNWRSRFLPDEDA